MEKACPLKLRPTSSPSKTMPTFTARGTTWENLTRFSGQLPLCRRAPELEVLDCTHLGESLTRR